jgi:hypothetical protein
LISAGYRSIIGLGRPRVGTRLTQAAASANAARKTAGPATMTVEVVGKDVGELHGGFLPNIRLFIGRPSPKKVHGGTSTASAERHVQEGPWYVTSVLNFT